MGTKITNIVFILACIIIICDSSNLDNILMKCQLTDDVCHIKLFGALLPAAQTGVLEIGVKPVDPLRMSNITTNVLGMVDFTLVDGKATGMKNCETISFTTFTVRQLATMHIICNIKTEGTFRVLSSSPVIQKLFGDSINGEADGTLILDGLNIFLKFHYNAKRGEDGEDYIIIKKITHTYVYSGKTKFVADALISNDQDANDFIVNFLEENSSFIKASIGTAYVAKVIEFYYDFCDKFFKTIPAKKYILDDLTPNINN